MKIFVRSPNWIGDQILSYPFYFWLRSTFPKSQIVSVCVPWVESIQFKSQVDDVWVLRLQRKGGMLSRLQELKQAADAFVERHGKDFDLGFSLPVSFSSAAFMRWTGVNRRVGHRGDFRKFLLTDVAELRTEHRADTYVDLLREVKAEAQKLPGAESFWGKQSLDEDDPDAWEVPPTLESFDFEGEWSSNEFVEPPTGGYFVISPGSQAESRTWPIERFAELSQSFVRENDLKAVVLGGPKEVKLGNYLQERLRPNVLDFTCRGSIGSMARVIKNAKFFVGNDSGLAHIAALLGVKTHVIWGAGDPKRTRPLGRSSVQMSINPVKCWPCEKNYCGLSQDLQFDCLKGIQVERTFDEIKEGFDL